MFCVQTGPIFHKARGCQSSQNAGIFSDFKKLTRLIENCGIHDVILFRKASFSTFSRITGTICSSYSTKSRITGSKETGVSAPNVSRIHYFKSLRSRSISAVPVVGFHVGARHGYFGVLQETPHQVRQAPQILGEEGSLPARTETYPPKPSLFFWGGFFRAVIMCPWKLMKMAHLTELKGRPLRNFIMVELNESTRMSLKKTQSTHPQPLSPQSRGEGTTSCEESGNSARTIAHGRLVALLIVASVLIFSGRSINGADDVHKSPQASRFFFTSQGKTAIGNTGGTEPMYLDFDAPGQATWQPGASFPDGRRVIVLSMEPRRDGPGRPFDEFYTQTPTHLWQYDLESKSLIEICTVDRIAPFTTPALLLSEDRLLVQVVKNKVGQIYSVRLDGK